MCIRKKPKKWIKLGDPENMLKLEGGNCIAGPKRGKNCRGIIFGFRKERKSHPHGHHMGGFLKHGLKGFRKAQIFTNN